MKTKIELLKAIDDKKVVSAWNKGVKIYAYELVEAIEEADDFEFYGSPADKKMLLNGADDWKMYSEGGCALCYDYDIALRLCTPSELKKTDNGRKYPNSRENWIDCQARALYQAWRLIKRLAV